MHSLHINIFTRFASVYSEFFGRLENQYTRLLIADKLSKMRHKQAQDLCDILTKDVHYYLRASFYRTLLYISILHWLRRWSALKKLLTHCGRKWRFPHLRNKDVLHGMQQYHLVRWFMDVCCVPCKRKTSIYKSISISAPPPFLFS